MRDILENLEATPDLRDPEELARKASRMPLPKRFYDQANIAEADGGYAILLDGRLVKTPARRAFVLPNALLAQQVADEFSMQEEVINPAQMPLTRLANTVIDGIADDMQPVFEDILRFATTDMLLYRADSPKELVALQSEEWDPILDWAAQKIGAHFILGEGVMHVEQPREAIQALSNYLRNIQSPFALAAIHTMTTLTGSALLALVVATGEVTLQDAWKKAHLDEDWQIAQWGEDEEAKARRLYRQTEMAAAAAFLTASDQEA